MTMYTLFLRTIIISFFAAGIGIAVNFLSPQGINLMGPPPVQKIEGIDFIEKEGVWKIFQEKRGVFIDARSVEEFSNGHIPGAMLLSLDNFDENISVFLDP